MAFYNRRIVLPCDVNDRYRPYIFVGLVKGTRPNPSFRQGPENPKPRFVKGFQFLFNDKGNLYVPSSL